MNRKIILLAIRYLAIILAVIGVITINQYKFNIHFIVLFLIFIINNQLRFFTFSNNRSFFISSIITELILAIVINNHYGGVLFLFLFCLILDLTMNQKNIFITITIIILAVITLVYKEINNIPVVLSTTLSIVTLASLGSFIKDEHERKIEAQRLYDRLRISEENLKKAKGELENYASTIEELTLLRERNRISREIHDSVGHSLSTMIIQLGAIEKISKVDGNSASEMAGVLLEFAKESLQQVRTAVSALKPREFEKYQGILAIEEMIKSFMKLTDVEVRLALSKERYQLNQDQSFILYRVVQEFLTNSIRHGEATLININITFHDNLVYMRLKDNGLGCDNIIEGIGLKSIKERVEAVGGNAVYISSKDLGFELNVTLPKVESLVKEKNND